MAEVVEEPEMSGFSRKLASGSAVPPTVRAVARDVRLYIWGFSSRTELTVNSAAHVTVSLCPATPPRLSPGPDAFRSRTSTLSVRVSASHVGALPVPGTTPG